MAKKSPVRLLLNAESFGFGPSAAIASFFPYLRERFEHIAYVATGHSLDLHRNLPYDEVYDISSADTDAHFEDIVSGYDLFLTALDSRRAQSARNVDVPTIMYDPLTWYWPSLPDVLKDHVLYIAQDFHGVRERLEKEREKFSKVEIVSPIISTEAVHRTSEHVLINLGGLQNPYWSVETAAEYARVIIDNIKKVIPASEKIIFVTSEKIAASLNDPAVKTYSREKMLDLLPRVKYAVMTSGLGNIYEVAGYDIPTVFLPPANDSQALQLAIMKREGMLDATIEWSDLMPETEKIDYSASQAEIMQKTENAIHNLRGDIELQARFSECFKAAIGQVANKQHSNAAKLIERFGAGGAEQVADIVTAHAAMIRPKYAQKVRRREERETDRNERRI